MKRCFKKCLNCNIDISLSNYIKHVNSCRGKYLKLDESWKKDEDKYECPYCRKNFSKKGICSHIWRKHGDGKDFNSTSNLGIVWNKGLTKKTDDRVKISSEKAIITIKNMIKEGTWIKRKASKDFYDKLAIKQSLNNSGGRCKWYDVSGQKVQGTWERDFAILMDKLNVKWIKIKNYTDSFIYYKDNKRKVYTPDFYINEIDKYIEIKGFWWGNDKEKMKLVIENNEILKHKLLIIEKNLFKIIINIDNKYDLLSILTES